MTSAHALVLITPRSVSMANLCCAALRHLCVILVLRLAPFAVYAAVRSRLPLGRRIGIAASYVGAILGAIAFGSAGTVAWIAAGMAYFAAAALGMNTLTDLLADRTVSRGAAFLVLFFVFMLLPGMLFPGIAYSLFLAVGWDLLLSGYSYCVDNASGRTPRPTRGECLFFLFVNPMLVYSKRGSEIDLAAARTGLGRTLFGATLLLLKGTASGLAGVATLTLSAGRFSSVASIIMGVADFLLFYAAHSGLAHVQLGLMRLVGWTVPERYDYPLMASSPADFWRRWNTYVRLWLESYIFLPLGVSLARRTRRPWAPAVAAIVALLASGLLHDAFALAGQQTMTLRYTKLYVGAAAAWSIWRLAARMAEVSGLSRYGTSRKPWIAWGASFASRSAMAGLLTAAALHLT